MNVLQIDINANMCVSIESEVMNANVSVDIPLNPMDTPVKVITPF